MRGKLRTGPTGRKVASEDAKGLDSAKMADKGWADKKRRNGPHLHKCNCAQMHERSLATATLPQNSNATRRAEANPARYARLRLRVAPRHSVVAPRGGSLTAALYVT